MALPRFPRAAFALTLLLLAAVLSGQAPNQTGPFTVLSRDSRRVLPVTELQGRSMVGLDDLATFFQLQIREDAAANAVTATFKNQTLVLTPDQTLVSASGRLISLPSPLVRQGRRWLVPVEFISRALAPIYDQRLELRAASRLVIVGDLRVPRVSAQYDESPGMSRITLQIAPRANATVTQEPGRLLVRIEADTIDASLSAVPTQQGLLTAVRVVEPATIQVDLGPRFSSFRSSPPPAEGANAVLTIEVLAAADSSAAPASPAAPAAPVAPAVAGELPVFGGPPRPTLETIVIDPGHGGDDEGVKGVGGATEKTVTLAIALRVRATIEARLGLRVLLTHQDARLDGERRAAIANNNKADLFVSLHANGSPRPATRGATIFTLGLDRMGEDARRQSEADREVLPVFGGGTRDFSLIEWELAQAAHVDGSNAFAGILDQRLRSIGGLPSVALQRAPIRNLAGANMPAVLVELGYLSNGEDAKLLSSADTQGSIAAAITDAIVSFRDYLEGRTANPRTENPRTDEPTNLRTP